MILFGGIVSSCGSMVCRANCGESLRECMSLLGVLCCVTHHYHQSYSASCAARVRQLEVMATDLSALGYILVD